jgi:hypothetical protein
VYERHRHLARAEPLLLARGRLERAEGVVNVIVRELVALERFLSDGAVDGGEAAARAHVHHLPDREPSPEDVEVGSSIRAVAPPVQSFGMGRRR